MRKFIALAAGFAFLTLGAAPALAAVTAQQAQAQAAAIQACTGPNVSATACRAAIQAFVAIAPRGADGDELRTSLIAALAATATPATQALLVEVIVAVVETSDSAEFKQAAFELVESVSAGEIPLTSLAAQGSPN